MPRRAPGTGKPARSRTGDCDGDAEGDGGACLRDCRPKGPVARFIEGLGIARLTPAEEMYMDEEEDKILMSRSLDYQVGTLRRQPLPLTLLAASRAGHQALGR